MRVYYNCYYDGRECKKVIPKLDKNRTVIQPSNKEIKKKYGHFLSEELLNKSWDACDKCERNYCINDCCNGILKIGD